MKLSIIIPTFNESRQVGWTIQYLQCLLRDCESEIIIADSGSNDGTRKIARNLKTTVVECNSRGRAMQMNCGAGMARGDVLFFLHVDSFPPTNFLKKIENALRLEADAGCFRLRFDDPHPLLRFYSWFTRFDVDLFRFGDQGLFIESTLFRHIGGFDETLTIMEDQEIVRRIRKAGGQFIVLNDSVTTSARKYKTNGVLWLQIVFCLIVLFYYCGAGQNTLIHLYKSLIKH